MCGIIAYNGNKDCVDFLLDGIENLEYRGYDSCGISVLYKDQIKTIKSIDGVENLKFSFPKYVQSNMGIAHTRWATHGKPSIDNAHPVITFNGKISLVHNGIIENNNNIKQELFYKDKIIGETDSEIFLYLILELYEKNNNLFESVKKACCVAEGSFGIVVMSKNGEMVIARKQAPIILGFDQNDIIVSSDIIALSNKCDKIITVPDNSISDISFGFDRFINFYDDSILSFIIENNKIDSTNISKNNFEHFMLKEIYEQNKYIDLCLKNRVTEQKIILDDLLKYKKQFLDSNNITIVACGSSYYAAILGKYFIEELCGIKVRVEYSSEFINNNSIVKNDIIIAISQSGETADTISAIKQGKKQNAIILGITNTLRSSISRLSDCEIDIRAGKEISVASTKAFTNQVISLLLFALWLEQHLEKKIISKEYRAVIIKNLLEVSIKIKNYLNSEENIENIKNASKLITKSKCCLFMGRNFFYPIALEGSLKLKEVSYIYSEAYAAGELKHGPLAIVDSDTVVVALINNFNERNKIISNIKEIETRGAQTIYIGTKCSELKSICKLFIEETIDIISPLLAILPIQLLAYYSAKEKNLNVDKPRNLAKSVTVE